MIEKLNEIKFENEGEHSPFAISLLGELNAMVAKQNEIIEAVNRLEKRTICSCDDCMIQRQQNSA